MSYPAEDRHERDAVSGPTRNPAQDIEKHDKSKVLSANPGGIFLPSYSFRVIPYPFLLILLARCSNLP